MEDIRDFFKRVSNKIAEYLGTRLERIEKAIKDLKFEPTDVRPVVQALGRVEKAIANQKAPQFSGTVKIDQTALLREIRDLGTKISKLKFESDDKKLVERLDKLEKAVRESKADNSELLAAIKEIKLSTPDVVRLDSKQIDRLANAGRTADHVRTAKAVEVQNVSMATANTEYSLKFPGRTVAWEVRLRATNVPLLVAYETGKLPTSGDGGAYFTVPAYYVQTNDGTDWGNKTIYLQTGSSSQVAEFIIYKAG